MLIEVIDDWEAGKPRSVAVAAHGTGAAQEEKEARERALAAPFPYASPPPKAPCSSRAPASSAPVHGANCAN